MKDPTFEISDHRAYWVSVAERLARPLLTSLASGRFNEEFPVEGDVDRALLHGNKTFFRIKVDEAIQI